MTVATRMRRQTGIGVDAYPCPFCGNWHVGRRPKPVQREITKRRVMSRV